MKRTQQPLQFTQEQLFELKASIKTYFLDELDIEIGDLQADLFVEFLNETIAPKYYNLGVADTITAVKEQANDLVLLLKE